MFTFFKNNNKFNPQVVAFTNRGYVRTNNEDAYLVINDPRLPYSFLAVADGMGGHEGGSIVSRYVINVLYKAWEKHIDDDVEMTHESFRTVIVDSLKKSNQWIYNVYMKLSLAKPMGTTFTGILIDSDRCTVFHVGDSRLYMSNNYKIVQVTKDHTWVQSQIKKGLLTEEDARVHPSRYFLNNCLGSLPKLMLDIEYFPISKNLRYFLSTDGLHNEISDESLHDALCMKDAQDALDSLSRTALIQGGVDNLTGIIVSI